MSKLKIYQYSRYKKSVPLTNELIATKITLLAPTIPSERAIIFRVFTSKSGQELCFL